MHLMAVKKSRKRSGFVVLSHFKDGEWGTFSLRNGNMGWTSGRSLPVKYFVEYPTGSPSSKYEHRRAEVLLRYIRNIRICMGKKNLSFL